MSEKKKDEPWKISEARIRRASVVCQQIQQWRHLAEKGQFPRSLHDIVRSALLRAERLGAKRGKR